VSEVLRKATWEEDGDSRFGSIAPGATFAASPSVKNNKAINSTSWMCAAPPRGHTFPLHFRMGTGASRVGAPDPQLR